MDQQVVRLRNGAEEFGPLVSYIMLNLRTLMDKHVMAFYDLVMLCRDPTYELFGNNGEILHEHRLIERNGQPHDSIRNIVLSAAQGEGLEMTLGSPLSTDR